MSEELENWGSKKAQCWRNATEMRLKCPGWNDRKKIEVARSEACFTSASIYWPRERPNFGCASVFRGISFLPANDCHVYTLGTYFCQPHPDLSMLTWAPSHHPPSCPRCLKSHISHVFIYRWLQARKPTKRSEKGANRNRKRRVEQVLEELKDEADGGRKRWSINKDEKKDKSKFWQQ